MMMYRERANLLLSELSQYLDDEHPVLDESNYAFTWLSGFYHYPAPGPERGYHRHVPYRASAHTGAGRHTVTPVVQQRLRSSASAWHSSAPHPDGGIYLTGGITADGLHISR